MLKSISLFILLCFYVELSLAQKQIGIYVFNKEGKELSQYKLSFITVSSDTLIPSFESKNKFSISFSDSPLVNISLEWKNHHYSINNLDTGMVFLEFYIDTTIYCEQFFVAERMENDCNKISTKGNISISDLDCYNFLEIHKCNREYSQKYYTNDEMRGYYFIQMPTYSTTKTYINNSVPAQYENADEMKKNSPK